MLVYNEEICNVTRKELGKNLRPAKALLRDVEFEGKKAPSSYRIEENSWDMQKPAQLGKNNMILMITWQ